MKFTGFWYVTLHSLVEVNCILEGASPHSSAWKVAVARADLFEMPKENSVQPHGITSQKAIIFIGNKLWLSFQTWLRILLLSAAVCPSFCVRCASPQTARSLQGSDFLFKPSFSNTSSKDNVSTWKLDEKSSKTNSCWIWTGLYRQEEGKHGDLLHWLKKFQKLYITGMHYTKGNIRVQCQVASLFAI